MIGSHIVLFLHCNDCLYPSCQ